MDIRFVSTLTAEDENLFAPALLKAIGALLDQLPIAYTVRIETTGAQIFNYSHAGPTSERPLAAVHVAANSSGLHPVAQSGTTDVPPHTDVAARHLIL